MKELKQLPKAYRHRLWIKYLSMVFGGVGIFSLLSSVVILALFVNRYDAGANRTTLVVPGLSTAVQGSELNFGELIAPISTDNTAIITSFAIYGVDDEGGGADVTMIGSFNRQTGALAIINIPRDTFITQRPNTLAALERINRRFPVSSPKITDLFRVGNTVSQGPLVVNTYLEEWLGIQIDYYAVIDTSAFRHIVDLVGPIEMYIPRRLWYDPGFGEPIFNVPAGWNMLDGQHAEWVVRYRATYAMGDYQRIGVQQEFMRLFFEHMLDMDVLLNMENMIGLLNIIMEHVETNFSLTAAMTHARHLPNLSSLNMQTMPGDPTVMMRIGQHDISFVTVFQQEMNQLVNRIFHGLEEPSSEEEAEV